MQKGDGSYKGGIGGEFQLEMDAKMDAQINAAMEEMKEIMRKTHSSQTRDLNRALSNVPAAIKE